MVRAEMSDVEFRGCRTGRDVCARTKLHPKYIMMCAQRMVNVNFTLILVTKCLPKLDSLLTKKPSKRDPITIHSSRSHSSKNQLRL